VIHAELSEEETFTLQRERPRRIDASIGEILLACCIWTLSHWMDHETVLVDLTDRGRHELFNDISLSRTVGYLTTNVPIVIRMSRGASLAELARVVRDYLKEMPKRGMGFGILRYLSPENEAVARLRRLPQAEVKFNYLGSMMAPSANTMLFQPVAHEFPGVLDPEDQRAYLHNLELSIIDGCLRVEWKYSSAIHRTKTIETLLGEFISALRELIREATVDGNYAPLAGTAGRAQ
jgi:non-ribosomal peptide synthase protein (TIGR01720 family)